MTSNQPSHNPDIVRVAETHAANNTNIPAEALLQYRIQQLPIYHYSPTLQYWVATGPSLKERIPPSPPNISPRSSDERYTLKVATLNVWFDNIHKAVRTDALQRILQESDEDVFCLQELTKPVLDTLLGDPIFREKWATTNVSGRFGVSYGSSDWYGQCTLVNRETATILDAKDVYLKYEERECRPLTVTLVQMRRTGQKVQVINVHLQSLQNEGIARQEQVRLITILANQADPTPTITAGDTNFYTPAGLAVIRAMGLQDVWHHLRPGEEGHTFAITYVKNTNQAARRLDCIFYWPAKVLAAKQVDIFGQESLRAGEAVYLSDHLGLRATFTLS